jgi:hypothetical protein
MTCQIPGVEYVDETTVADGPFILSPGWYGIPAIYMINLPPEQVAFLKRAVGAYRPDDPFFVAKKAADPNTVGMSTDMVHIDFYGGPDAAASYVAWLNQVFAAMALVP